jgi:hypothetical protein
MPPSTAAGNWWPYGEPEMKSLSPPFVAKQQFPLWNVLMTGTPWFKLYAATKSARWSVSSPTEATAQPSPGDCE